MKLVRKVDLARWQELVTNVPEEDVSADFVTSPKCKELKTDGNTFSLWRFDPDGERWQSEAALALAGPGPDSITIAWIDEADVHAAGITIQASAGKTCVPDLAKHHVDLQHLGSSRLSRVAHLFVAATRGNSNYRAYTRDEVLALFVEALVARRINLPNLPSAIQTAVAPLVAARSTRPPEGKAE